MFSTHINYLNNNVIRIDAGLEGKEDMFEEIKKNHISPIEADRLLNLGKSKDEELYCNKIIEASRTIKLSLFNGIILALAPLYVTSICQEHCLYCNYRAGNKDKEIQRVRLSNDELVIEVEFLAKKGFRVIELVYATDPFIEVDNICEHIKITHNILLNFGGGVVGLNTRPYLVEDYKKLREAGLNFIVIWQETYNETQYTRLHPGNSEKTDFYYRLNAPERMIAAGIKNIGLGILSGLSDWRKDWYMLINHINYLLKNYGDKINSLILGIPRLKPAVGALLKESPYIPNDREYLLAISVFNFFFPTALPFVNTREKWETCIEVAKYGGTLFTFDCKTIPGGYALSKQGYQFPTYSFTVEEYTRKLNGKGLSPIFNWNFNDFNWKTRLCNDINYGAF